MLHGKKINLRLVTEKDLTTLYQLISNLSNRGLYFPQTLISETEFKRQFFKTGFWNDDFGRFVITDKNDCIIGSIYYFKIAIYSDALELGYILFDDSYEGKGCITEALSLMVHYLFSVKTMNRLQVRISLQHEASKKVALKTGFRFEGIRRSVIFLNGKHCDLEEYAILRDECP